MKKVLVALTVLFAAATVASAQMRPSFKVEAGANFSNMTSKSGKESVDGKMSIGYRAGVGAEFALMDGFYVNPGVYFLSRGTKESVSVEALGVKTTTSSTTMLHNVEIPIHFGYRADLGGDMGVSVQAGPYLAYGFLGNTSAKMTVSGKEGTARDAAQVIADAFNKTQKPVDPYKEKILKPFDWGVGMQAAFEYTNFNVHTGFEYGLMNVSGVDGTKANHMNFYVGVGYRF